MPEPTLTTARTPRHALPFLFAGQAQKEAFVNEALAKLDTLIQPVVLGEISAPPALPASGDCYLVAGLATGAWTGHERSIASWVETQWLFAQPCEGARVHDVASGALAVFTAANGWRRAAAPAMPTGGPTQDTDARAALAAIVAGLHRLGIFSA